MKKVKCINNDFMCKSPIKIGEIYEVLNETDEFYSLKTSDGVFCGYKYQFKEIKSDKIRVLLKNKNTTIYGSMKFTITITEEMFYLRIENNGTVEHTIRWGKKFNTTLKDIQPLLDALNIEIVEELPKKYKLKTQEYDEETAIKLKELGLELEEI